MTAKILDGKVVNEKIAKQLRTEISKRRTPPKLVIIQVGDLPESNAYIGRKKTFGEKIGAIVDHQKFPKDISQNKLITHISELNTDASVTGIIVQMPLPAHLDKDKIIESITPVKDVDGLTSTNLKLLWEGPPFRHSEPTPRHSERSEESNTRSFANAQDDKIEGLQNDHESQGFTPATTKGVLTLLDYYKIPVAGKHVVVVGRSFLVGKPTALAFLNRNATVTVAHSKTRNLKQITRNADILVVAAGKPKLIGKEHVKKGQVVIDVGINVIEGPETVIASPPSSVILSEARFAREARRAKESLQGRDEAILKKTAASFGKLRTRSDKTKKLVGDVDFDAVKNIVAAISPVPGGIGPMTVASLFQNLLDAYKHQT